MLRAFSASLFLCLAVAPAALAFPGDRIFTGKLKCITTYNGGTVGPFASTDVVTLAFTATVSGAIEQTGTVALSHTETNTSGIYLDDDNPMTYRAFVNPDQTDLGLVAIYDDGPLLSGAVSDFKRKADGSVSALRFVSTYSDGDDSMQRCSGTLKLAPVD
jgi:hypothetical protein